MPRSPDYYSLQLSLQFGCNYATDRPTEGQREGLHAEIISAVVWCVYQAKPAGGSPLSLSLSLPLSLPHRKFGIYDKPTTTSTADNALLFGFFVRLTY